MSATKRMASELEAHGAWVLRTLRCLGVPEREVEDARQDVLEVALRRGADVVNLRGWMYGICVRKALARRRDAARRREEPEALDARASELEPDQALARAQALTRALAILDAIDDDKRAVLVLYEVEQLTMAEVAAVVGCPLQTAYARLYAARREVEAVLRRERARGRDE